MRGFNSFGLVFRLKIEIDVGFILRVGRAHGISGSLGDLECVGDCNRDVLAVVPNYIVRQWGTSFIGDAAVGRLQYRTKNLPDVCAMKDCAHARHFLCLARIELLQLAVGDRRFDWNGIQQAGKVKVRRIHRGATDLKWTIDARRLSTDRRCSRGFGYRWHLQHSSGSLRHQFQSVHQTAFRQLYLKSVLALRFRVAQRRLRCFLKNSLRRRLPG